MRVRTPWKVFPIGALAFLALWLGLGLYFNASSSLPHGIYRNLGRQTEISRGAIVVACLPLAQARVGLSRGYLTPGSCPADAMPVGKPVVAIPGDTVTHTAQGLIINGRPIPNSPTVDRDSRGRPMAHEPYGTRVIRPGEIWLTSTHAANSWDSRYFGVVEQRMVRAVVVPFWTW